MEEVDLQVCRGYWFAGDSNKVAVMLPGAFYLPASPLLWFSTQVLQAHGWSVLQVWDTWTREEPRQEWVDARLQAAFDRVGNDARRLVVAKSLTTLALPTVAESAIPGLWFTPLLNYDEVRSALASCTAPTLAVGGAADPTWDGEFLAGLGNVEVIEIAGADHAIQIPGDPAGSIGALGEVTAGVDAFVGRLG